MRFSFLFKLAWQSLLYRKGAALLTALAIAISVFCMLGTEHMRTIAKEGFSRTVSGVDLIIGPRTSDINLLLTSVFRIGQPSQNMSWNSYQMLQKHPDVAWTIPISLGDSHKSYRVVGTEQTFFQNLRYANSQSLRFEHGGAFEGLYDVVLGFEVARRLGYSLGDKIILSHGMADTSFSRHDNFPFMVSGVLAATGTPIDNALYVSLLGMEAIHHVGVAPTQSRDLQPESISAAFIGLNSRLKTFKVQRQINKFTDEALVAVLPGVALTHLWQISGNIENILAAMSYLILLAALFGLCSIVLATLRERRYEFVVFRNLGASSVLILLLTQIEIIAIALIGIMLGGLLLSTAVIAFQPWGLAKYGIDIGSDVHITQHLILLGYVLLGTCCASFLPLIRMARG